MNEEWRDIKGYEGKYQVSNLGRVKSLARDTNNQYCKVDKIIDSKPNKFGYLNVNLYKKGKGKSFKVHRLAAIHFIENPENLPEVNHKDEDKTNNRVDNLEWCSRQYNVEYSQGKAVIGINKVSGLILEFPSISEASRQTGINSRNICACLKGRQKSTGGYYWHYASDSEEVM